MIAVLNTIGVKYYLMGSSKTFGQVFAEARNKQGLSQNEVARRLDKSPTWISYIERDINPSSKTGKPQPSREFVESAARVLQVPRAELLAAAGFLPDAVSHTDAGQRAAEYVNALPAERQEDVLMILESFYHRYIKTGGTKAPKPSGKPERVYAPIIRPTDWAPEIPKTESQQVSNEKGSKIDKKVRAK